VLILQSCRRTQDPSWKRITAVYGRVIAALYGSDDKG